MNFNNIKQNINRSKKINRIVIFFLLGIFTSSAQMDIQLNTYWQNPYYITPAHINDVHSIVFTLSARQQWMNFNGAPKTIFGSASSFMEDLNTQIGMRVFNDKVGFTSVTDVSLIYAYNLKLNDDWWANLGIAGSYQSLDFDLSKVSFEGTDEFDVYSKLEPKKGINADVGAEIFNYNFRFGLSGRNLVSIFNKQNPIHFNTNYIYGIYRQHSYSPVEFGGGVFGIQYGNRYQMELNASAYFKTDEKELFHTGFLYRAPKEIGAIAGINISPSFSLSYCYDYNFGIASHRLGQTHEIMITYKLDPKPVLRWDDIE